MLSLFGSQQLVIKYECYSNKPSQYVSYNLRKKKSLLRVTKNGGWIIQVRLKIKNKIKISKIIYIIQSKSLFILLTRLENIKDFKGKGIII